MQNRPSPEKEKPEPINWQRGMFRLWIVASTAWMMGWLIYLAIEFVGGVGPRPYGGTNHAVGATDSSSVFRVRHEMGISRFRKLDFGRWQQVDHAHQFATLAPLTVTIVQRAAN
jgi:hypothetical protein